MMKTAAVPHKCTPGEGAQTQRLHVEMLTDFRITGKQNLKSAIQTKTFYLIGANPSAGRIFRL